MLFASNGDLMRNVKENSKGYITDADPFTTADGTDKRDVITMSALAGKVDYSNDTLTITGTNPDGGSTTSYVLKDDCKATLMVGGGADELLKDKDADYELYQTTVRSAAGILKNYGLTGTVYVAVDDEGSHVATDIYFYVSNAKEIVPADLSDDAGIASVAVKGLLVNDGKALVNGATYTITVPYAANQSSTQKMLVTTSDPNATVAVYEGVDGTTDIYTAGNLKANTAFSGLTGGVTFKVVVTAEDGTTKTTAYVTVTTVETASKPELTAGGSISVTAPTDADTAGKVEAPAGSGSLTIADLKAALTLANATSSQIVVKAQNALGVVAEVADTMTLTDAVSAGAFVEAIGADDNLTYEWNIAVAS